MSCMYLRIRSKNYKKYCYCTMQKKIVSFDECNCCDDKYYKKVHKIKGSKHKRTHATDINRSVKELVWDRDNHKCIFCGKVVDKSCANAHFVPRSAGGLGIEENTFTACLLCHYEQDNGLNTKLYDESAEKYLRSIYGAKWDKSKLIYKKWEEIDVKKQTKFKKITI